MNLDKIVKASGKTEEYLTNVAIVDQYKALEVVKEDGWTLPYVHNQTEEICIAAVKQAPKVLQYVRNQTDAICKAALRQDGSTLKFVDGQTRPMCLVAVMQNGYALQYVHNQTEEICLAAVKQNGYALRHVNEQTEAICKAAVKENGLALQWVRKQTEEICLAAVKKDGSALPFVNLALCRKDVPKSLRFEDVKIDQLFIDGSGYLSQKIGFRAYSTIAKPNGKLYADKYGQVSSSYEIRHIYTEVDKVSFLVGGKS